MDHSPAEVLRSALIDLGLATDPSSNTDWPAYFSSEPDKPDSVITVYDTTGFDLGRQQIDGHREESHGVQIRFRSTAHRFGFRKARAVAIALDESVYDTRVVLGTSVYRVQSVVRSSGPLVLGRESPQSNRRLFTVNALVTVNQTS